MITSDYLESKNFHQVESWEEGTAMWEAVLLPDGCGLRFTVRIEFKSGRPRRISLHVRNRKAKDGCFFVMYDAAIRSVREEFHMRSGGVWNVLREFLDAMGCPCRGRMLDRDGEPCGGFELEELSA